MFISVDMLRLLWRAINRHWFFVQTFLKQLAISYIHFRFSPIWIIFYFIFSVCVWWITFFRILLLPEHEYFLGDCILSRAFNWWLYWEVSLSNIYILLFVWPGWTMILFWQLNLDILYGTMIEVKIKWFTIC